MQNFNEFLSNRELADVLMTIECDVDALCDGVLGLAQQGKTTEQDIIEAILGPGVKLDEFLGMGRGIASTARGASALAGMGAAPVVGAGKLGLAGAKLGLQGAGWLGKKALGGLGAAAKGGYNLGKAGLQGMAASGRAAYQAQARRQVIDRIKLLKGDLAAAGVDQGKIAQLLGAVQAAVTAPTTPQGSGMAPPRSGYPAYLDQLQPAS